MRLRRFVATTDHRNTQAHTFIRMHAAVVVVYVVVVHFIALLVCLLHATDLARGALHCLYRLNDHSNIHIIAFV